MVPCAFCTTWFHAFCAKRRLRGSTLDSLVSAWYHVATASEPDDKPEQRAGSRASGGKMGKRKSPGQTARRALLLWPLVCTGGNGSGGVRPGAGGGADLLAVPVGMVSAGTVPGATVPASRLALAVLHPGRFLPFAGGVRFST